MQVDALQRRRLRGCSTFAMRGDALMYVAALGVSGAVQDQRQRGCDRGRERGGDEGEVQRDRPAYGRERPEPWQLGVLRTTRWARCWRSRTRGVSPLR